MKRTHTALALLTALTLASCSAPQNEPPAPNQNLTLSGEAISAADAQMLTLSHAMTTGKFKAQNATTTAVRSVLVRDLDGQPFFWLTTTGPSDARDFFDAARRSDAPVTATGASSDRSVLVFEAASGLGDQMAQLQQKIGEYTLTSPHGTVLYAVNDKGTFDVRTGNHVEDQQLQEDRKTYDGLKQAYLNDKSGQEAMHNTWKEVLDTQRTTLQNAVAKDGNLIAAQALRTGMQAQTSINDDPASWGWFGRIQARAGIAGSGLRGPEAMATDPAWNWAWKFMNDMDFGNRQNAAAKPYSQSLPAGGTWGMRFANPAVSGVATGWDGYSDIGARIGCVPTAVMRALESNALTGGKADMLREAMRTRLGGDGGHETLNKMRTTLTAAVPADSVPSGYYEPRITQMMGGGEFMGGTLVTPLGFGNGIQAVLDLVTPRGTYYTEGFIRANIAALSMNSSSTWVPDFNTGTYMVRDAVRRGINEDGNAVMFLYNSSFLGGHMSISSAYRSYEYLGYTDVFLYMGDSGNYPDKNNNTWNGKGDPFVGSWINVTNRWEAYGGAVAIRQR